MQFQRRFHLPRTLSITHNGTSVLGGSGAALSFFNYNSSGSDQSQNFTELNKKLKDEQSQKQLFRVCFLL